MSANPKERPSDSPYVASIWHGIAEQDGDFTAPADARWELIVKRLDGKISMIVSGQVTKAGGVSFQAGTEILSIKFNLGTFMSCLPINTLQDTMIVLPEASSKSFWLNGSSLQFPDYENADTFVKRLLRDGVLLHDPVVEAALQGHSQDWSIHTIRRRFLRATGFTHSTIRQIERARYAADLLAQGVSILDTVDEAGYFDQLHLTRSLKHYMGQTPAQIASQVGVE